MVTRASRRRRSRRHRGREQEKQVFASLSGCETAAAVVAVFMLSGSNDLRVGLVLHPRRV